MSSRQSRYPSSRRRKAPDEPTILALLWPIVLGILATFLTVRLAGMLTLMGTQQFALLYPWVVLVKSPVLGIDRASAVAIAQVLLFFQFPIYGFVVGAVLYATGSLSRAFLTVFSGHLIALAAVVAIAILYHP